MTVIFHNFFSKVSVVYCLDILCFVIPDKMGATFESFSKVDLVHSLDTLGVENFDEIALSLALSQTVKEIEAVLCLASFGENVKDQNGHHF